MCKEWCLTRPRSEHEMLNLTCNVTLEGLSTKDWVKEVRHHSKGLRSHAEISNRLLHEWLESDHRPMLS